MMETIFHDADYFKQHDWKSTTLNTTCHCLGSQSVTINVLSVKQCKTNHVVLTVVSHADDADSRGLIKDGELVGALEL